MKKISILCLLLCCTTVKAVDSANSTLHQRIEMVMKKGDDERADIVRMIEAHFPEKFDKIKSNSDSLRFLVDQEDVISHFDIIMGEPNDTTILGKFADLLLEPQFIANIDNILTSEKKKKKKNKDSLLPGAVRLILAKLGDIVKREGVDCLTDETLPIAFHSSKHALYLWLCLDDLGRQILNAGSISNHMFSTLSDDAKGMSFDKFIETWQIETNKLLEIKKIKDPEHRKIVNDYFHENFSSRED